MSIFILLLFFFFFETDLCHEKQHKRERAPTSYDKFKFLQIVVLLFVPQEGRRQHNDDKSQKERKKTHKISSRACEKHVILFCDLNLDTTNMMAVTFGWAGRGGNQVIM